MTTARRGTQYAKPTQSEDDPGRGHEPDGIHAATVAVVISDHGPFSPRVLIQRAM